MGEADKFRNTAVHVAGYRGFADVLRVMIARAANLDAVNRDGCTPLHFACAQGHVGACATLCDAGASMEARSKPPRTTRYR